MGSNMQQVRTGPIPLCSYMMAQWTYNNLIEQLVNVRIQNEIVIWNSCFISSSMDRFKIISAQQATIIKTSKQLTGPYHLCPPEGIVVTLTGSF